MPVAARRAPASKNLPSLQSLISIAFFLLLLSAFKKRSGVLLSELSGHPGSRQGGLRGGISDQPQKTGESLSRCMI